MPKSTTSGASASKASYANATEMTKNSDVDASGLLDTFQGHVDNIRSLLQCGICVKPLFEPFTLACGHTYCYSCLATWFSEERSNKSCPDCRASVKAQPAPAYLVRKLVQLFTSRPELLGKGETIADHTKTQRQEAEAVDRDKKNDDPREGGLFRGTFKPRSPTAQPIVDLEDNVVRCPRCSWELEEDSECAQCGYRQDLESVTDTESAHWSESEENSEMTDYHDEVEDGFGDTDNFDWAGNVYNLPWPSFFGERPAPLMGWRSTPQTIDDSEGEEEEEEDDYDDADMDSFIDDDEQVEDGHEYEEGSDPSTVVGGNDFSTRDHHEESQTGTEVPISQEDGYASVDMEDEEEEEEDGSDYEDDENDEEPIRPPLTGQRRRPDPGPTGPLMRRTSATPWASGNQFAAPHRGAGHEIPRNQSSDATRPLSHNTIDISDDSDEGPVVSGTRTRNGVRASFY